MRTPFFENHVKLGAKIVDFHGWDMPLQYSGILDEQKAVRSNVGLFDISHMGRFRITGETSEDCIQNLITNDISEITENQAIYSPMCNEKGGIIDDVIVSKISDDEFLIVVNSSNIKKDFEWIQRHLDGNKLKDETQKVALLALQGPKAQAIIEKQTSEITKLKSFHFLKAKLHGQDCIISRTGYTGEDGFEIFFDSSNSILWERLLSDGQIFGIKPAGLGARDVLRLEAGMMLYGNDIDESVTPLEAPLKWTVKFEKNFIGKNALEKNEPQKRLFGFEVVGSKRVARQGDQIIHEGKNVGRVTSGTFSPTLGKSIGFGYVPPHMQFGQDIQILIGGKNYDTKLRSTRFYKKQ